jgi:carboxyl-terminal processing protease
MGALAGISLAVMFAAGFFFHGMVDIPPMAVSAAQDANRSYPLLDEVQTLLDQHYVRQQPDYTQRQYAAIRGLLGALNDRYTFFIDPPVAQSESDVLAGTYGGIGVQIKRSENGDIVLHPFPDGPAAAAGIQEGDILKVVNDTTIDLTIQQDAVDQMLRGEVKEGSGAKLTVTHADGKELTVFIPFAVINVPSVIWRIIPENTAIGYIQIIRFTSRTPDELKTALEELQASNVKGLLVDLRNNAGGLLQESIAVASQFVSGGEVIVYEKTSQNERAVNAEDGGLATDLPLVVLVNQGTASAAELVAGAIQDHQRGILVGQTTYGKGTVQQIFRLSDDSSIHITSAEWLTPNQHHLDGIGLQPDISMIPDPNGRDVEIGEAIRALEQTLQS